MLSKEHRASFDKLRTGRALSMRVNPKSEYRNPKQIQIFKIRMSKTYSYEDRVSIVWSIGALEFRICFVLRASYFEFDIQPPL